jgi:hypothetical protein
MSIIIISYSTRVATRVANGRYFPITVPPANGRYFPITVPPLDKQSGGSLVSVVS